MIRVFNNRITTISVDPKKMIQTRHLIWMKGKSNHVWGTRVLSRKCYINIKLFINFCSYCVRARTKKCKCTWVCWKRTLSTLLLFNLILLSLQSHTSDNMWNFSIKYALKSDFLWSAFWFRPCKDRILWFKISWSIIVNSLNIYVKFSIFFRKIMILN